MRSTPGSGAAVAAPLRELRLWFSEAPELVATRFSLRDASGRTILLGPLERGDVPTAIHTRVLEETPPGTYTVTWRITGRDGHPVTGSFSFTVTTAGAAAPDTTRPVAPISVPIESDTVPVVGAGSAPSLLSVAVRSAVFLSMIALIGAVAFAVAIIPRVDRSMDAHRAEWYSVTARVGLVAAATLLVALCCRLLLQWRLVSADVPVSLASIVTATAWGRAWLLQGAATAVALAGFAFVRHHALRLAITATAAIGIALGASLSGHAAASPNRLLALTADSVHIISASAWLGGLVSVMIVVWLGRHGEAESGAGNAAALVTAFSPLALTAAGAVVVTGLARAYMEVGAEPAWGSAYVRVLALKLAVLAVLLACGAYNWQRVKPSLTKAKTSRDFQRSGSIELAIGALVIVITAALVAIPLPDRPGL